MADRDNVVDLRPWDITVRSAIERREAYALIERSDADQAIRSLTELETYYAVKALGADDAAPLLAVIEPQQIRAVFDLDVWHKDRIDLDDVLVWLSAFREVSLERLQDAARAVDPELLALLLKRRLWIAAKTRDDVGEDPPPWVSDPPDEILPLIETPDRRFVIAARARDEADEGPGEGRDVDEEDRKAALELVDALYKSEDWEFAATILRTAEADLSSELEETAHRFKDSRIEDLGFPPLDRALEIYTQLDPERTLAGEAIRPDVGELRLPAIHASRISDGLLRTALRALDDPHLVRAIEAELVPLANAALAADLVEPGDLDRLGRELERVRATLELALAWNAAGDPIAVARDRLTRLPIRTLFSAGWSVGLRMKSKARALIATGAFAAGGLPLALAEDADRAILEAITLKRPLFSTAINGEHPPSTRPIQSPEEIHAIERALSTLEDLAAIARNHGLAERSALFEGGLEPPLVEERTIDLLIATAAANVALGRGPALEPLDRIALGDLAGAAAAGRLTGEARAIAGELAASMGRPISLGARERIERRLADLAETLAPLAGRQAIDPRFVGGVIRKLG